MEDMPVNLDDGELWLPSDIFPPEEAHHHPNRPFGASLEDLSRQFADLNFLDHHPIIPPKVPPISKRLGMLGPMAQYALTAPSPNGCYGLTVGPIVDHGLYSNTSGPVYATPDQPGPRYRMHKPVPPQQHPYCPPQHLMETRLATSTRPLHGLQNRPLNRLLPFQANGLTRFGSSIRNCRGSTSGTGVFIPRATTSANKTTVFDGGKRKSAVLTPHRGPTKSIGIGRAKDYCCRHHQVASSEVGLPKDWSY